MELIGRRTEIGRLTSYCDSGKPEFVALYGRRRVGKTYLIDQLFGNRLAFRVTGVIEGSRKDEEEVFLNALRSLGYSGTGFKGWYEAFAILRELLEPKIVQGQRCLIFIDELPCFDTPRSSFIKAFGDFWNGWCLKHPEVMLMVCGSATTWMVKNIINSHGGLHNRITHELHLHPFTLGETEEYLAYNGIEWDRLSIVQIYSILGGIPYYLELIDKGDSVATAVDRLFFSEDAELKHEYDRLFKSLFKNPDPYVKIIDLLSKNKSGLTRLQIASELSAADNGHLGEYLGNLEKCDFIRQYYVKDNKGRKLKSTGGIYQLMDMFTLFYKTFLTSPTTDRRFWSSHLGTPKISTWHGLAFEKVCMMHVEQIKEALGISQIGVEYFSWRSRQSEPQAQIDLILERADRITNVCEIKFSEQEYVLKKEEELKVRNRIGAFKTETNCKASLQPVLITTYGLAPGKHSSLFAKVVTMDSLFK